MTNDQIIELARHAGCSETWGADSFRFTIEELQRFAELVRNEVLDEAANVCRKEAERALFNWKNDLPVNQPFWSSAERMAAGCANDIANRKALK